MKRPKIEIDEELEEKINAEAQWEIYRETFKRDKIDKLNPAKQNSLQQRPDWEEEIIEEVIQQLKEEQKKLDEEEKQRQSAPQTQTKTIKKKSKMNPIYKI